VESVDPVSAVEAAIGYRATDREAFREAFVHRSYSAENDHDESYERLEFLGDAVLQLVITDQLFESYPGMSEGQMAKVRAAVVNERTLAAIAERWHIGPALLLGRGEELTGGRVKTSILADVVESVIGAVYREAGLQAAKSIIHAYWDELVDDRALAPGQRDYKTRLQELLARSGAKPLYRVDEEGPEHAKTFSAAVYAGSQLVGSGVGSSKKRAEQAAAEAAIRRLESEDDA
jgi:ribonuclease-3